MGGARHGRGGRADRAADGAALRLVAAGSTLAALGTLHAALNARLLRAADGSSSARVSVLIPARDEAATIGACLDSIGAGHEVIVCDDGSRDETATIAAAHGARVLTGRPLPDGWLGKPWACRQLAEAATCDVLVFLDADVRLAPGAIGAAVGMLKGFDLVSPQPRQEAVTVAERLVQPLLQWSVLTTLPLRVAERSARESMAAANGQFVLVRRDAYERAGGHVAGAVLDDLALARAIRRARGRTAIVDGTPLATCRMYSSWPQVRDGYGKSLWSAFGPPPAAAVLFGVLGLAYVLPPLAALRGSRVGLAGYLAAVAGRMITAQRTGGRVADAWAHPVSIALAGYLTARSHVQHRRGRISWKNRQL